MKKALKITGIILAIIILLLFIYVYRTHLKIQRGDLIKFNGYWYTKEELAEIIPPQNYEAPAQNTPEQVYAEFRQALLDDDLEKALGLIVPEKREKMAEALSGMTDAEKWINNLPSEIVKESEDGNFAYYYFVIFDGSSESKSPVRFVKDLNGYWRINFI